MSELLSDYRKAQTALLLQKIETEKQITMKEHAAAEKATADLSEYKALVDRVKNSNIRNRIYDFMSPILKDTVDEAAGVIASWHRESHDPITLRLNSPGGDPICGLALFDTIRLFAGEGTPIITVAVGNASSMASVLLQAGTRRLITPNAYFMVHELSAGTAGTVGEQEEDVAFFRRLNDTLIAILAERSTLTAAEITKRSKKKNWWLNAQEVIDYGFADAIEPGYKYTKKKK